MKFLNCRAGALMAAAALLTGCFSETVPQATAENCSPVMYEKVLAGLSKESSKNEFKTNCHSLLESKKLTDWTFKKSPKDDF
ncbi:entry exclusion lipoprotein TrbK [Pseudomonas sp. S32]|uniref:entry exclusion lipoprotein TrbK n=1 Tax=Pseudomonas sp. S32 TaxID=2767448 RepID=UPI001F30B223|nr:entry exclusion lipoprotein TrbK [Pseudomonas sp. S32]MBK5005756.1 entry exclusion lipoprotein TrbK [Pseudomonas sp. S32]